MNSYLNKQNSNVQDITRDLSDGVKLIQFLELLSGTQAPFKYHAKVSLLYVCVCGFCVCVLRWGWLCARDLVVGGTVTVTTTVTANATLTIIDTVFDTCISL